MSKAKGWTEIFDGGSPEAERKIFLALAEDMLRIQEANRQKAGASAPRRTLHAKLVAGFTDATLKIDHTLPDDFAVSWCQPGASLSAIVRFSNASGVPQQDTSPDMRGVAIRLALPEGKIHDLLMTSFPVSHARNASQFVKFALIAMSGERETMLSRLTETFGEEEALRMLANIRQGLRPCASLALERFWSRGAFLWGSEPVRFELLPASNTPEFSAALTEPDALRDELAERLKKGDVYYRLALQRFVNETDTPIEDAAIEWKEDVSPPIEVATLIIPQQDLTGENGKLQFAEVDQLAFNPWNAPAAFRPLGNLNRARGEVYGKSASRWLSQNQS